MSKRDLVCVAAALIVGCVGASGESRISGIELRYSDRSVGVISADAALVSFKWCSTATARDGRDCVATSEIITLPWADYQRGVQLHLGPELEPYAGAHAQELLGNDMRAYRERLNEPLSPAELEAVRAMILELERMRWKLGRAEAVFEAVRSDEDVVYLETAQELFAAAVQPFKKKRSAWKDGGAGTIWYDPQLARMNWFDAAEVQREPDPRIVPRDPFQSSCWARLGEGWRLPTAAEADAAYSRGLRSSAAGGRVREFWTRDVVLTGTNAYALAFDFILRGVSSKLRSDTNEVLCVLEI